MILTALGRHFSRLMVSSIFICIASKFPDLNFIPYVLYIYSCYMKPVCHINSEPGLPVVASLFCALVTAAGSYALAGSGGVGHVSV